ncbi:uncharacterized protein arhgef5 isoform X2 [Stigmatopora nigra]
MGSKKPTCTVLESFPNTKTRDFSSGGRISRDSSPRAAMTTRSDREEGRRDREREKAKDKSKFRDADPRERYHEPGPAPRMREASREKKRDERRNGRPLSTLEREFEKQMEFDVKKGDTFPRMRRSRERDGGLEYGRPREKPRRTETDAWDRDRERARHREMERVEWRRYEKSKQRHHVSSLAFPNHRRDSPSGGSRDRRERDRARRRDISGGRDRGSRPDREDWERTRRKAGARGTRSEGDSDERETGRVRARERDELAYQHSRSEGDSKAGAAGRETDRDRRRGTDRSGRGEESKVDERALQDGGGRTRQRREREYYRGSGLREGRRRQEREADPRWDDTTLEEAAPRAPPPPKAQSSGEWSSDMDNDLRRRRGGDGHQEGESGRESEREDGNRAERREQRRRWIDGKEKGDGLPEHRRMWLEPQRGRNSKESSQEDDFGDREKPVREGERVESRRREDAERREGTNEDDAGELDRLAARDGHVGEIWPRDVEGGSNSEDSEGGNETGWRSDKERMLSGEDGFVTVSSGADDDDEDEREEFLDCQDYWEGGDTDDNSPKEEHANEEELTQKGREPKYVFCVIGQTLPTPESDRVSSSPVDEEEEEEEPRQNLIAESLSCQSPLDQRLLPDENLTNSHKRFSSPDDPRMRPRQPEHPYAKIGPFKRDTETEKLLMKWRQRSKAIAKREEEEVSALPKNPYADVYSQVTLDQILPALEGLDVNLMSPEEKEAIRIRMSGAWSMTEEPKRHSQAPHLKWAKNVVREILGHSGEELNEDHGSREPAPPSSQEEDTQLASEMSFHNSSEDELHSEPELEEEDGELLEVEVEGHRDEDDRSKSWGEVELRNVLDTIGRRKRNSKFFNRAQLYQQYSEAAQNFEILRQSRSDVPSACEDSSASSPAPSPPPARRPLPPLPAIPHPHSLSHAGSITSVKSLPLPEPPRIEGRPSSPRLSIALTESATLWRELPGVRNSGELEDITEDERRLQEVRFEVVTSEASYCRSLDIVVEHFVKSKQLGALLATQDRNWLFSRLADVRAISHSFLSKLEERLESDIMHFTVCDIIARHCQRFKMVYVPYLTNQSYQDATYQRLMNENPGFRRIVEKLERSPVCQRLPLRSFLVLPFQRITRIKLLVQNIVKRTTAGTAEATQAIKALRLLEKLILESNDSISQMKSIESLVSLSARVDFECRTLPLISQSRRLVREGPVTELMDFSLKDTERNIYMHLFNDYLLLSQQKEGGKFTVIDHAPVAELRAENCRVKLHSLQKNLFRLHTAHKSLLLRTDTQSDKLRWISALSRPHPEVDFSSAQDFPQMQCIRAVVAQQPDELSLEKADIILVHQQSSDHWVEGTRLSDGHRGWVPESHLELINNARVRQRNLSDALKLATAAV